MNVWREDELTDWLDDDVSIGWFPEQVDFVPSIAGPSSRLPHWCSAC